MSDEPLNYEVLEPGAAMEDAEPDTEARIGAWPNPAVEECPVVPLGTTSGKIVFAMPNGEIRKELASKIGQMLRTDIFACAEGQAFLVNWRDGDNKFQRELASIWFVRKCREAGYWDSGRAERGLGVWSAPGAVILHKGDEVWEFNQAERKVLKRSIIEAIRASSGPLYVVRAPRPAPDVKKPATALDGEWFRDKLDLWRWDALGHDGLTGADAFAGWVMASALGAVAPFRGHLMLNAMAGSGKTTLVLFVHALLSAIAGDIIDDFTPAGLRNDLAGMARPVLIDEAEGSAVNGAPGAVEQALGVLRRMATGEGGHRKQGDVAGGSVTQTAVGAVLLAAINPPRLETQDAERFAELRLLPLRPEPGRPLASDDEIRKVIEQARALAPKVLGRALAGAARYRADVAAVKAAMARQGQSPRAADLVAMLAAGRRLLLCDEPLDEAGADAEIAFWSPLIKARDSASEGRNPGAAALQHLFAADSGKHSDSRRLTIGEIVHRWLKMESRNDCELVLRPLGIRLEEGPQGEPQMLVANNHPALERIFASSRWPDYRKTLGYLDALGEEYKPQILKPLHFGMHRARGLAIPLAPWMDAATAASGTQKGADRSGQRSDDDVEF